MNIDKLVLIVAKCNVNDHIQKDKSERMDKY